ncbi:MAG TPA: thioredoxin TrxC [Burkholderiales bacterium]|jgi:thioredoxin 2
MSTVIHVVCGSCGAVNRVPRERMQQAPSCGRCKNALLDGTPVELTGESFERFIARNDLPVVVDFWAGWCAPCKTMAPVFAQAAREQRTRLRMAKLDTDAQAEIAHRYAIRSIPTLLLFEGGREVDRVSGALDAARLRAWLQRHTG